MNNRGESLCFSTDEDDLQQIVYNSYHIHVLFWTNNEEHRNGAMQLRENFLKTFNMTTEDKHCTSLLHQNASCYFNTDLGPAGPFLTSQWAVYVSLEDYQDMSEWITKRRGKYDVLIHPNSGCNQNDHAQWPVWAGTPWEIDVSIFKRGDFPDPWRPPHYQPPRSAVAPANSTTMQQSTQLPVAEKIPFLRTTAGENLMEI